MFIEWGMLVEVFDVVGGERDMGVGVGNVEIEGKEVVIEFVEEESRWKRGIKE